MIGSSDFSREVTIIASSPPSAPTSVTTTADKPGAAMENIIVEWQAPFDGGSSITGYKIKVRHIDSTSFTDITQSYCASSKCTVPITVLMSAPINLNWGSRVVVSVIAINIKGDSAPGIGNQAILYAVPDAPRNLENDPDVTNANRIKFTWQDGPSNGGK